MGNHKKTKKKNRRLRKHTKKPYKKKAEQTIIGLGCYPKPDLIFKDEKELLEYLDEQD